MGVKSQRDQLAALGDGEYMQGNTRGEEWGAGVEEITLPWLPSPIPPHQAQAHRLCPWHWPRGVGGDARRGHVHRVGTRWQGRPPASPGRQAPCKPRDRVPTCPCYAVGREDTVEGGWGAGNTPRSPGLGVGQLPDSRMTARWVFSGMTSRCRQPCPPSGPELAACTHWARAGLGVRSSNRAKEGGPGSRGWGALCVWGLSLPGKLGDLGAPDLALHAHAMPLVWASVCKGDSERLA